MRIGDSDVRSGCGLPIYKFLISLFNFAGVFIAAPSRLLCIIVESVIVPILELFIEVAAIFDLCLKKLKVFNFSSFSSTCI